MAGRTKVGTVAQILKFCRFEGRATKAEFWLFVLLSNIAWIAAYWVDQALGVWLVENLVSVVLFVPWVAVAVRRIHDTGRTGWALLLLFLPGFGALILLFIFLQQGSDQANEHGPNPRAQTTPSRAAGSLGGPYPGGWT